MKVYFLDPMGYGNLASYDSELLKNIEDIKVDYFTNQHFNTELKNHRVHPIYRYSDKRGFAKIFSYLSTQLKVLRLIKRDKPVLVHFQWLKIPSFDNWLIKRIKTNKAKVILTAHNVLPHDSGDKYRNIYKKIYRNVDAIIVHANNTRDEIVADFGIQSNKIHVIPHGVLDMRRTEAGEIGTIKKDLIDAKGLENKVVFSVLGSINKYKGVNETIKAWLSLSKKEKTNIHLIIAGNGMLDVLNLVEEEESVTLINRFLTNEEFLAIIHLSDYVMLPYLKISQSGVLLTVLNEKKRVIVSNKGGLSEPFQFGEIGFVLDEVTVDELKDVILKAAEDSHNVPDTSIWNKIHDHYSWERIGKRTEALYTSLIS